MSWAVIPAPNQSGQSGGGDDEMKQYGQMNRMNQPDFYQKEQYKEEHSDEGMLPGQKLYYMEKQGELSNREQSLRGKMYDYFSKSQNIPSSDMQSQWNKELMDIGQQKTKLQAESSLFKQNYTRSKDIENKLIEGGDKSTANRIALTYDNGVYLPTIGEKEDGGQGWLTHIEATRGFDYAPGENKSGQPIHTGLLTSINYSGDFNKFVEDGLKSAAHSKEITSGGQTTSPLFGTENSQWMSVITGSNNAKSVMSAASNLMEGLPESARLDLTSKFYEKLLHGYQKKDGSIAFAMDNDIHEQNFNQQESGVALKLLNMQKLTRGDKEIADGMVKKYGQNLLLSQVPGRIDYSETTRDIKVLDKGTGEGNVVKGGFTQIATGKMPPVGAAEIAINENGIVKPSGLAKVITDNQGGKMQLNHWQVPQRDIAKFNDDANKYMNRQGGIMPDFFSKGFGWFYSQDGAPNHMDILDGSHVRIVGITGDVQENFEPEQKKGKSGFDLDLMDIGNKLVKDLKDKVRLTVRVNLAVPTDSPFFKRLNKISGVNIEPGVDKDSYDPIWFDEWQNSKKGKQEYKIVPVDMPITPDQLYQFEDEKYSKGTQHAQEQQIKQQQQNKDNYTNQLINVGLN